MTLHGDLGAPRVGILALPMKLGVIYIPVHVPKNARQRAVEGPRAGGGGSVWHDEEGSSVGAGGVEGPEALRRPREVPVLRRELVEEEAGVRVAVGRRPTDRYIIYVACVPIREFQMFV